MIPPRKHFLLVPFPAFGHIIPLLELAKKIAEKHDVTFALSADLYAKILKRELVTKDDLSLIAVQDGYTETATTLTNRAEFDVMHANVTIGMRKFFAEIPHAQSKASSGDHGISNPVDIIIADNFLAEPLTILHARGIPYYFFNTGSLSMTLGSLFITDDTPILPDSRDNDAAFVEVQPPKPGEKPQMCPLPYIIKKMMLPIRASTQLTAGVIVNSVRDLDKDILEIIRMKPVMTAKPVHFVGPLLPAFEKITAANIEHQNQVKKWLDKQTKQSVVYVSFGSIAFPPPEQIKELGRALLDLKKPFILSLNANEQRHLPVEISAKISSQFDDEGSCFLVLGWAPQKLILQHPSTSVFLSHCGWNSTLESLSSGIPVVAWPMFAEQKMNAMRVEQHGLGVMVVGTGVRPARIVPAEEIVSVVEKVGWGDQSTCTEPNFRAVAQELSGIINGAGQSELQKFLDSV